MKGLPFISVVMPVYNCAQDLDKAIESILYQTFEDFEFIIVNDGSTDGSLDILYAYERLDSRIKIVDQENSGIVGALNNGLAKAKGEWVFRMDGDDVSLPQRFAMQIEEIRKRPGLILLGGWCEHIDVQGNPLGIGKYPVRHVRLVKRAARGLSIFPHPSVCFHRETIQKLGGYRQRFEEAEDMDLWLRVASDGEIGCLPHIVIQLRGDKNIIIRRRRLYNCVACVCYHRQNLRLSDPAELLKDTKWQEFLSWVDERLETDGYYENQKAWIDLLKTWRDKETSNVPTKVMRIVSMLVLDSSARKAFCRRIIPRDFALELAKESRDLF